MELVYCNQLDTVKQPFLLSKMQKMFMVQILMYANNHGNIQLGFNLKVTSMPRKRENSANPNAAGLVTLLKIMF